MKKLIPVFLFLALSSSAFAQAQSGGVLDTVLARFVSASVSQMSIAQGFAQSIFLKLAAIDIAIWSIRKVLQSGDLSDFIGGVTLKVFSIAFFWTMLVMAPTWMPLITQSFISMGTTIGGAGAVITPTGVVDQGVSAAAAIWNSWDPSGNPLSIGSDILLGLSVFGAIIFTLVGFLLVALQLLMTQIELALIGSVALVFLGFSGAAFTTMFSEKYFGYIMSIGIKLMMIFVLAGVGAQLSQGLVDLIQSYQQSGGKISSITLLTASSVMLLYGGMAMMIPAMAAGLMNGTPSMTSGAIGAGAAGVALGVSGAAMAGAGAAVAMAGAAGSASSSAMGGLEKLAKLTGFGGAGSGAGSSMDSSMDSLAKLAGGGSSGATAMSAASAGSTGMSGTSTPGVSPNSSISSPQSAGGTTSPSQTAQPTAAPTNQSTTDSINNPAAPSGTGSGEGSGSSKASKMMDQGLTQFQDSQNKLNGIEGGGGSFSIRLNHLGD